jgi:hypothetical protein
MMEVLAVPHSGVPQVHIGLRIVLYSKSLFSVDSSDNESNERQRNSKYNSKAPQTDAKKTNRPPREVRDHPSHLRMTHAQ